LQECIAAAANQIQEVFDEGILVFICHTSYIIHDIAGIVTDKELSATGLKVWIVREHAGALDEAVISSGRVSVCSSTSIIQSRKDPRRTTFFNKLTYNLVVEKVDRCPFDLFANIFLLFCLQG
jgi:hypothetical protein